MQTTDSNTLKTIVQIIALDGTGDSCYRMSYPAQALAEKDGSFRVINLSHAAKERYHYARHADLLVLFNPSNPDLLTVIEQRKRDGLKTLVELNDNYYGAEPWMPVAKAWQSIGLQLTYEAFLKIADSVMVTGPGLAEIFAQITAAPIHQIKNHLPKTPRPLIEQLTRKEHLSFGWAGSLGHIADILSVTPAFHHALELVPQSSFSVMGNSSLEVSLQIEPSRFNYTPWGNLDQYYQFWEKISVGIIPLLDTPYNRCRSDIKVIEMVAAGVIPIVPRMLPYNELIERFSLLTYHDNLSLSKAIQYALAWTAEERLARLSQLFDYICSSRIEAQQSERYKLYLSLLPPSNKSNTFFTEQAGYHEVEGTPTAATRGAEKLEEFRARITKDTTQAVPVISELKKLVEESPHHPEFAVTLCHLLMRGAPSEALACIQKCRERFPRDIRFDLLHLSTGAPGHHAEMWEELLKKIECESVAYQKNAREVIKQPLIALLNSLPQIFCPLTEHYLQLFPHQHLVRLALANQYERLGLITQAKSHFASVLEAKILFEEGLSDLGTVELGYISAWHTALNQRLSQ